MVGKSEQMHYVFTHIEKVARMGGNVLITGETGTGKELVAREIHERNGQKNGPFVAVNCSAFAEGMLEAEFFGHEQGAFTGAHSDHAGKFEQAGHGTLFLDEIGDMSLLCQSKLLRAIENKCIERVGGKNKIEVDCRIVSATNTDLPTLMAQGRFREDLFFRLETNEIRLPRLNEREGDIPLLVEHYLDQRNHKNHTKLKITEDAVCLLVTHEWRGNVRELFNALNKACTAAYPEETIDTCHLSPRIRQMFQTRRDEFEPLKELEKKHIDKALFLCGNNVKKAAGLLGIKHRTLYYKMLKQAGKSSRKTSG
jgi:two-component system NtrC family response regulator